MRGTHNLKKSSSWFWRLLSKSADLSKPWGRFFQILCALRKSELWYRLSADSRATRVVFLISAVKSTFFPKNAKIKCVMNKNLIRIVRKKVTLLPVILPCQERDSSTLILKRPHKFCGLLRKAELYLFGPKMMMENGLDFLFKSFHGKEGDFLTEFITIVKIFSMEVSKK